MSPRILRLLLAMALLPVARAWAGLDTATLEVRIVPAAAGRSATRARLRALDFAWSAEAEERQGRAWFAHVPPGRHELTVERPPLPPARAEVRLEAGSVLVLEAALGGGTSSIETSNRDQPTEGTSFDEALLRDLPSGREPWSLLETAEPVAIADRMDTGGVWAARPGRVTAHGASLSQAAVRLGALDVADPLGTGRSLFEPDLAWLSGLRFVTAILPVDVPGAGPLTVAVPRRPTSSWSGSLTADGALPEGRSPNPPAPIARLDRWRTGSLVASGPLRRGRLGVVVAASLKDAARFEREERFVQPSNITSGLAELFFTPATGQEGRLRGVLQDAERPFEGRARLTPSQTREDARAAQVQGGWEVRRPSGAVGALTLGFTRGEVDASAITAGGTVERLRDGPVPALPLPGKRVVSRTAAGLTLELPGRRLLGTWHALRLGGWLGREAATTTLTPGVHRTAERLNGIGARVWEHVAMGQSRWTATEGAAWLADRLDLGRLTLDSGARLERLTARARGGANEVRWLTLSPRVRARWRPREAGTLAFLAAWGRFRHDLPLSNLAFGDPAAPVAAIYRWDDRNGDGVFGEGEQGPLVRRAGPGAPLARLDPELRAPHTEELVAGVERRGRAWTARFVGVRRRERHLLESIDVGVPPAAGTAYRVFDVTDPAGDLLSPDDDQLLPVYERRPSSFGQDGYLLTNPEPGHNALHEGVELTLAREGERLDFLFGATAHRSSGPNAWRGFRPEENDQGLVGERFDDPNADTNARGRLFSDRAYTIKVAARYQAPGDLRLGAVARYQDGQPFARLVIVPGLAQGTEAIQAVPNGRHRFEFAITVDVRAEKGFAVGRARLAAVAEGFNLLGNAHEVEEDVVSGPGFRTPTASQPPRVFRLGLRLDF